MERILLEFYPDVDAQHIELFQSDRAAASEIESKISKTHEEMHKYEREIRLWGEDESAGEMGQYFAGRIRRLEESIGSNGIASVATRSFIAANSSELYTNAVTLAALDGVSIIVSDGDRSLL